MDSLVVIPTYNEADNIQPLVQEIFQQAPQIQILIVDDHSPDGTGTLADRLAVQYPGKIHVLHRSQKEGLGRAYLDGFGRALALGAERIVQMDADFSHPPSLIPKLLESLATYDFVLASRYIPGGGVKNWNFFRRLLSKSGNLYAQRVLGLRLHDLTGGFKAFHRSVLESLISSPIDTHGYAFQIEMTVRALAQGFRCMEIPFVFVERKAGKSKMSKAIIGEALLKTFRLRKLLKNPHFRKPAMSKWVQS